jgi:hypothetical protein
MKTIADNAGRKWVLALNVDSLEDVRARASLDLLESVNPKSDVLSRLSDPVELVRVLWVLCSDQGSAMTPAIVDRDFRRAFSGDALDQAMEALIAELIDFFPSGRRDAARKYLGLVEQVGKQILEAAGKEIEGLDPAAAAAQILSDLRAGRRKDTETRRHGDTETERALGVSSGSSPGLPGSPPAG